MKLICIASLIIIGVLSQTDCSSGGFSKKNGECMFNCQWEGNYIEISTLSFDFIKDICTDRVGVPAALFPDDCNSLDDLYYSETTCGCPYCKCSTPDLDDEFLTLYSYGPEQTCYDCFCSTFIGKTDELYFCDYEYGTNDPFSWNNYQCPPESCTATEYVRQYTGG